MQVVFDGEDIIVSINSHFRTRRSTRRTIISLTPRAANLGVSPIFGGSYMEGNGIPAMHIQSRWNHWWHTPEIYAAAGILQSEGVQGHYLYGASMGGYGAVMHATTLGAMGAIALSPQIPVLPDEAAFDNRWMADRGLIRPQFSDAERLRAQKDKDLWVFLDPSHYVDKRHLTIGRDVARDTGAQWHLIQVPYGDHAVGRPMQRSGALNRILKTLADYGQLSEEKVRSEAENAYKHDPKALLNFLRQQDAAAAKTRLAAGQLAYASADQTDPEVHFMAAEFFLLCDALVLALEASRRSIKAANPAPHLIMKHARIMKHTVGIEKAVSYLSGVLEKVLDPAIAYQALALMRGDKHAFQAAELEQRLRGAELWSRKFDDLKVTSIW